jgi:hypothetical protein
MRIVQTNQAKVNKKELSSTNAKSMTILTQKLKKLKDSIKENYTKFLAVRVIEKPQNIGSRMNCLLCFAWIAGRVCMVLCVNDVQVN